MQKQCSNSVSGWLVMATEISTSGKAELSSMPTSTLLKILVLDKVIDGNSVNVANGDTNKYTKLAILHLNLTTT